MDILQKTLNQMNFYFTSNQFSEKGKVNGLSQDEIDNGIIANFLHRNAVQLDKKRRWRKKYSDEGINGNNENLDNKIDAAIKLLKDNGYRLLKPINDWKEL